MKTLMQWLSARRGAAWKVAGLLVLMVLIHLLAWLTDRIPERHVNVLLVNQFTIMAGLIWVYLHLASIQTEHLAEVVRYRAELADHRKEIINALDHRVEDLAELHRTAQVLAAKTDQIAVDLAVVTKQQHERVKAEVLAAKDEIVKTKKIVKEINNKQ